MRQQVAKRDELACPLRHAHWLAIAEQLAVTRPDPGLGAVSADFSWPADFHLVAAELVKMEWRSPAVAEFAVGIDRAMVAREMHDAAIIGRREDGCDHSVFTDGIAFDGRAVSCILGGSDGHELFCTVYSGSIPELIEKQRLGGVFTLRVDVPGPRHFAA